VATSVGWLVALRITWPICLSVQQTLLNGLGVLCDMATSPPRCPYDPVEVTFDPIVVAWKHVCSNPDNVLQCGLNGGDLGLDDLLHLTQCPDQGPAFILRRDPQPHLSVDGTHFAQDAGKIG
jgi:hypothetical protein